MTALQAELGQPPQRQSEPAYINLPTDLHQCLRQIECDFRQSQIYQSANQWLQQRLPDDAERVSQLIAALRQEAIRLTLEHLALQNGTVPQPAAEEAATVNGNPSDRSTSAAQSVSSRPELPPTPPNPLADVGSILRQARQAKGLTIEQLHQQTHVLKSHIHSIEDGAGNRLPELIYVAGFIRQISRVLEVDSTPLLERLGHTAPSTSAQPPRRHAAPRRTYPIRPARRKNRHTTRSSSSPAHHLRPAHLYTGYATLMAGAVGSLCWVTWQPMLNPPLLDSSDQWQSVPQESKSSAESEQGGRAGHSASVPAKLRHFQLSKQRSRRFVNAEAIALPELILTPLQTLQTLKSQ